MSLIIKLSEQRFILYQIRNSSANISVPMGQINELANSQISQTNTTDYCSNVIYENGVLNMILTEEDYVTLSGDASMKWRIKQ